MSSNNTIKIFILISIVIFFIIFQVLYKKNKTHNILSKIYKRMEIKSNSFKYNEMIPIQYTCDGKDLNPNLQIKNVPVKTKELVLIVDDPDASGGVWTHWVVWGISPDVNIINEGELPLGAVEGITSFGTVGYGGPCPPKGTGVHRYFFKLYALNKNTNLTKGDTLQDLKRDMNGNVITSAKFIGSYGRVD